MLFAILFFVFGVSFALECEYADISPTHTMCRYPGPKCETNSGMTKEEINNILDAHNKMRSKVALGDAPNQPPAANMRQLRWDYDLAEVAQRWADQCWVSGSMHDQRDGRGTFDYEDVGQNVHFAYGGEEFKTIDMYYAIQKFFDEVQYMDDSLIDDFPYPPPHNVGHYTQLVWANSEAVGCGFARYYGNDKYWAEVVCNYGPGGNVQHSKMYEIGTACSKCPSGTSCSQEYPGLCA